jgi:hypothetical protein
VSIQFTRLAADPEDTWGDYVRIRVELPKPGGGHLQFDCTKTFAEHGCKEISGEIFNAEGAKCGELRALYFLRGDVWSWDGHTQETFEAWDAANASSRMELMRQVLKVSQPLNKCLFIELVWVHTKEKGHKYGTNSLLALFEYFRSNHGAKSMAARLGPLQHSGVSYPEVDRNKGDHEDDIKKLADYLAKELNLTFFGDSFWIHGPTRAQSMHTAWDPENGPDY